MLLENQILAFIFYSTDAAELAAHLHKYPLSAVEPMKEAVRIAAEHWDRYRQPPGDTITLRLTEQNKHHREIEKNLADIKFQWGYVQANLQVFKDQICKRIELEIAEQQYRNEGNALSAGDLQEYRRERAKSILSPFSRRPDRVWINDVREGTSRLIATKEHEFTSGIPDLDAIGAVPARGELHLNLAPTNRGKTFDLVNKAVQNALLGKNVYFLTQEMSKYNIYVRCLQNILGRGTWWGNKVISVSFLDKVNHLLDSRQIERPGLLREHCQVAFTSVREIEEDGIFYRNVEDIEGDHSFRIAPDVYDTIEGQDYYTSNSKIRLRKVFPKNNMLIERWNHRPVTTKALAEYFDFLEAEGFPVDVFIFDYLDKFQMPGKQSLQIEIGEATDQLREIAQARDMAVCTATQSNRAGFEAESVGLTNNSSSIDKSFHADIETSLSSKEGERLNNYQRVKLLKIRNEEGADREWIITQNYALAQYCTDSMPYNKKEFQLGQGIINGTSSVQPQQLGNPLRDAIVADLKQNPSDSVALVTQRHFNSRTGLPISDEYIRSILADRQLFTEEEAVAHRGRPGRPRRAE